MRGSGARLGAACPRQRAPPQGGTLGQIGVDQFVQQLTLYALKLLAAPGEPVTLEQRQVICLFLDHRVAVADRSFLLAEGPVLLDESAIFTRYILKQLGGQGTELVRGESVEVGARGHSGQYAKLSPGGRLGVGRIAKGKTRCACSTEITALAPSRCQGRPWTRAASCSSFRRN